MNFQGRSSPLFYDKTFGKPVKGGGLNLKI